MRASIDEAVEPSVAPARDDYRSVPHEVRLEIARPGNFRLHRDVVPGRTAKHALLLELVDRRIDEDAVGNRRFAIRGPPGCRGGQPCFERAVNRHATAPFRPRLCGGEAGSLNPSSAEIASAAFTTSAATAGSFLSGRRQAGPRMPAEAITAPLMFRIGAATHLSPSSISSRSTA